MERFEERVLAACKELLAPGDRVIAAVSGGADSMALLQFLLEYKDALGVGVEAAHVDHRMRPGSGRDAAFVARFCRERGVPIHSFAAEAQQAGRSEEWARQLRYGFFETLAGPGVKIATGHTLSDQAETLLLRLAGKIRLWNGMSPATYMLSSRGDDIPLPNILGIRRR